VEDGPTEAPRGGKGTQGVVLSACSLRGKKGREEKKLGPAVTSAF
jgi:hypothetical protein